VQQLLDHRIAREAAVLATLEAAPLEIGAITAVVYAGAPAAVRPMAERNVLAHLLKLLGDGAVVRDGTAWRRA
jgi:hypothetical protein